MIMKPMPRVLLLHTGGTLGMDPDSSFDTDPDGHMRLKEGTGGRYHKPSHQALRPGASRAVAGGISDESGAPQARAVQA